MDSPLLAAPLVQSVGWTLLHSIWQETLLGAAVALTLRAMTGAQPSTRYGAACIGLALMLAVPASTLLTHAGAVPPTPTTSAGVSAGAVLDALPAVEGAAAAGTPALDVLGQRVLPLAAVAWFFGVLCLSARLLVSWLATARLKAGARPIDDDLTARVVDLARRVGVDRAVRVLESARVGVPTVVGWLRPVILLPVSAITGLPPAHLDAVIAHELAHVRRCDALVNLAQTFVETLLFYHPAVWWCSRQIRIEREQCCDDVVVDTCGDRVAYARALAALEEQRAPRPALSLAATGGRLIDRIRRLLAPPSAAERRSPAWVVVGALALVVSTAIGAPAFWAGDRAAAIGPAAPSLEPASAPAQQPPEPPAPPAPAPRVLAVPAPPAKPVEPAQPSVVPDPPDQSVDIDQAIERAYKEALTAAQFGVVPVPPVPPAAPGAVAPGAPFPVPAPAAPFAPFASAAPFAPQSDPGDPQAQIEAARAQLERAKRELEQARSQLAEQEAKVRMREIQIQQQTANLVRAQQRLAAAKAGTAQQDAVLAQIRALAEALVNRSQSLQPDHPDVIKLRQALDELQNRLKVLRLDPQPGSKNVEPRPVTPEPKSASPEPAPKPEPGSARP